MKRVWAVIVLVIFLCGCSADASMDRALALRQRLLDANGLTFEATVTADYGENFHTFVLKCQVDQAGDLSFEVSAPDTISGITGIMSAEGRALTFDDQVLAFAPLADGQIPPISAPWLLIHTLRGGYIRACAEGQGGLHLTIDDSYEDDALQLDIWLDENDLPKEAEILWQGRRILTIRVEALVFV